MTMQKLSGLEHARRWMDSLGMRHYGEVDAAIAEAGAGASGYSMNRYISTAPDMPEHCPPLWQETGFAAYASRALEDQRRVGNDFGQLFDNPSSEAVRQRGPAAEKYVWSEALQAAKELVNSGLRNTANDPAAGETQARANAGQTGSFFTTVDVQINSLTGDVPRNVHSIDVTCRANSALAIHLWI